MTDQDQRVKNALSRPNSTPYMITVVVMMFITVVAIVVVAIARPNTDNAQLYLLIIGQSTTATAALLAYMKSQETHLSVNSRLEQFIVNADRAARSEGELAGRAAGRDAAEKRTDELIGTLKEKDVKKSES